jgi:tRNA uridine 5-carboxymethylaminomethyl modification enzyme
MSLANVDKVVLPPRIRFESVPGLKAEVVEKLNMVRPTTLGQASRIPGITPSAIQILHLWCERKSEN